MRKRGILFLRMYMDRRPRKVGQAARMIEVEMREHDVTYVLSPKSKCLDVRQRSHLGPGRVDAHSTRKQRAEPATVASIVDSDAGVDEHQTVRLGLKEQ